MTSIASTPSVQSEWVWVSPRTSAWVDEVGQRARQGRLDLAVALADLGRDPGHAEALVDIGLLRVEQQLAGVDHLPALLGQRPAAVERHAAQRDVVVLAAGEVDEVRAPCRRRADHEVDARAVARG